MPKQTLVFETPVQLSLKHSQLCISYKESPEQETFRAIEDIAIILIDNHSVNITVPLLGELAENNVAVVFCDQKHMPTSMLMNLDANSIQEKYFRLQLEAKEPLKKQMWKNIVETKIRNQAQLLKLFNKNSDKLARYINCVKSGDTTNCEGHAAQIYWKELMGKGFIRDRFGEYPNTFLNYGYTILRAATARALMGSGLLTANDRMSMLCILEPLPTKDATALADTLIAAFSPYKRLLHTVTSDNGKEFADHVRIAQKLDVGYYFAHPYHSWERGANENMNGLIRQYLPKGTSFEDLTRDEVKWIEWKLNNRPRT